MLSLVLCALATNAAEAAPARQAKTSAVDRDDDDAEEAPKARKKSSRAARKAKARDERGARSAGSDDDAEPAGRRTKRRRGDAEAGAERDAGAARPRAGKRAEAPEERDIDVRDDRDEEPATARGERETAARRTEAREEGEEVTVKVARPRQRRHRNELYFVAGVAHVDARVESGGLQLDPQGLASIAAMPGPMQGSIESDPANIVAGMIGFAPAALRGYIAFETLIGVPKTTELRATGDLANKSLAPTALGIVPTGIPPLGPEIGEAKAVPPMVTAIFRLPALGPLRFYVGGGASILFIRDAKITNPVLTEVATPRLEVTPAWGAVAQAGVDIRLFNRFSARIDVKELWFQSSEATISNIRVHTTIPLLETVDVGSAKSVLKANPVIVQAGIKASF